MGVQTTCRPFPIAADCVWMAESACCPCCMCCRISPEKRVLLVGRQNAGKTSLLYNLMLNKAPRQYIPTRGFNTEIVEFNRWQKYEFWDLGGSLSQRPLWPKFYKSIVFEHVVYVIDGMEFIRERNEDDDYLNEDRMELHALLNEVELRDCQFHVYLNLHGGDDSPEWTIRMKEAIEDLEDQLMITNNTYKDGAYRAHQDIKVVTSPQDLLKEFHVELEDTETIATRGYLEKMVH
jgi:GTPase SAR1 family protein